MPRIVGVDLPREKRIDVALRYLYGIGPVLSARILSEARVAPATRAKDLTDDQVTKIAAIIAGHKVEGDLRREVSQNIRRLIDIGSYRGARHRRGLPVRGQRTHTNARTRKGPRQTVGAAPKPAAAKPAASAQKGKK
ncbi:MAG: 30S ribosomal protein S13 [Candidatus Omnitrophica bacterium CG11_big_fil_rev_8_21_14_0_20_64_10]|nr:MAG: 30S ribosomal protein S13 [Candidatus Omnitrophica bacterium CG11_big_fil_rev_8_21_14_0_20_64_10]